MVLCKEVLVLKLWLVRHGTTRANLEGRLQGTLPFPLGPEGRKEVLCLATRLQEQPFSAFFCSNVLRARQTARILRDNVKLPAPCFTPLIQEYYWGILQGLTRGEISERHPELFKQLQNDFHRTEIPGAEGLKRLFQRATRFYRLLQRMELTGKYKEPVLVVSHGRFLQAFIQCFLAYDGCQGWPFSAAPASLSVLEGDFIKLRRLKLFNDTCHLRKKL